MKCHFYADDSQFYISFKTSCLNDMESSKYKMEACVRDIELWMLCNRLKLNQEKTEVLVFSSSYRPTPSLDNLMTVDEIVACSPMARNIGVIFDNSLSMASHSNAVCKSAFFHLHKISKIRKFLTPETTKAIIHAFVTSKIDYYNSLLFGLPKFLLQRLQRVLNCAARVVYQSNKYDHITPLLMELRWLPVEQRINFKILLITYKALNGQAPTYISDLLSYYRPARLPRLSTRNLLRNPCYNLKNYGGLSFAVAAPCVWNALPMSVRTQLTFLSDNLNHTFFFVLM